MLLVARFVSQRPAECFLYLKDVYARDTVSQTDKQNGGEENQARSLLVLTKQVTSEKRLGKEGRDVEVLAEPRARGLAGACRRRLATELLSWRLGPHERLGDCWLLDALGFGAHGWESGGF